MTQVYNPQWERFFNVDDALMGRMTASLFEPWHTGGGCMGWARATDEDGNYLLISRESSLGSMADVDKREWAAGRYGPDCEFIEVGDLTLDEALDVVNLLPQPAMDQQDVLPRERFL
jgi:hypothetical protein